MKFFVYDIHSGEIVLETADQDVVAEMLSNEGYACACCGNVAADQLVFSRDLKGRVQLLCPPTAAMPTQIL